MYLIILLVLAVLIFFYFALNNIHFIFNLFTIDLNQQKQMKGKKSNKNVKKVNTPSAPVVKKSETILQRYSKISVPLLFAETSVTLLKGYFSNFKDQVIHSLQDVRYVLNNVRDFWRSLTNKEEGEVVVTKSIKTHKPDKKKSIDSKKIQDNNSRNKETKKRGEKSPEILKQKFVEDKKSEKTSRNNENTKPCVFQQNVDQKSSSKAKKVSENFLQNTALTNEKKTKKNMDDVSGHPSVSTNEVTKKNSQDNSKKQERNDSATSKSKVTQKVDNKDSNQKSVSNQNNRSDIEELKSTKVVVYNNALKDKKPDPKISEKQNVITLEKNSKGKEKITIERNEQSGIKTVLVKKTKQTVYKQTENIKENETNSKSKENDECIGKISSIEELELIVKSLMTKDQEKAQNLMHIIQQVQNVKQNVQNNKIPQETPRYLEKKKNEKFKSSAENSNEESLFKINSKEVIKTTDLSEDVNISKENQDNSLKKGNIKNIETLPDADSLLLEKLEKIKNQDFELVGKISFEELGKIVNVLVSEKIVPMPKFSEPPPRKSIKKKESNANERPSTKSNTDTTKNSKRTNVSDTTHPKQQRNKENKDNRAVPFPVKPTGRIQTNFQSESVIGVANKSVDSVIKNEDITFPHLDDKYFGITLNDSTQNQFLDRSNSLITSDSSELLEEVILRENAVKNISALLEDDCEVQDDFEKVEMNVMHNSPNIEQSDLHTSDDLEIEQVSQTIQEMMDTHDANIYETTEYAQAFQEQKKELIIIEERKKAVVQELKDNFETSSRREKEKNENDVHNLDSIDVENLMSKNVDVIADDKQLRKETEKAERNDPAKKYDDHEEMVDIDNQTYKIGYLEEKAEELMIKNSETLEMHENNDALVEIPDKSTALFSDNRSEEILDTINADNDTEDSKTPIEDVKLSVGESEYLKTEIKEDKATSISNDAASQELYDGEAVNSNKEPETNAPIEENGEISNKISALMAKIIANDAVPLEMFTAETSDFIEASEKDAPTQEIDEIPYETSTEIAGEPKRDTSSEVEHQNTSNPSPVKTTLVRPLIKIDRCGDNNTNGDLDALPARIKDPRSSSKMVIQQQSEVRVLTLQQDQHQDGVLYRLRIGWTLEFRLGESLFGRRVSIFCNVPHEDNNNGHQSSYRKLEWANTTSDDTANYIRVPLTRAGSHHYYFTFEGSSEKKGSGYIVVDPNLTLAGEPLPLDAIQCVTVLARCLGPFPSWERKLQVARESGYNMVHFTPVQELGSSNSCYSLASQLDLNPVFSTPDHKVTWDDLNVFTEKLRTEWKMLSICDIVLNHTANETPWLRSHPEASYNLINSPHMKPAYLLDVMVQQLSDEIEAGNWEMNGVPRHVHHEDHLNALRHLIYTVKLPQVRIPELFSIDTELLVKQFQDQCRTHVPVDRNSSAEALAPLVILQDKEYRRLKSTIDLELALKIYNVYRNDCFDEDARIRRCVAEFKAKIDELNNAKIHEVQDHLNAAVENIVAGVRYYWVSSDGPRFSEISLKTPLVYRYFTDAPGAPTHAIDPLVDISPEAGAYVMCHNGWVMGADPLMNFAAPGSNVYLRREVIAWGDSVKLRFGDRPADNPWLWSHMKSYVETTARAFDGIRLDNCHSTPLPVAEYLLAAARNVRPNLYVVAELFTNSPEMDNIFVNRLAITSLIREAMSAWDSHELGRLVHLYGGDPLGAFIAPPVRPLLPSIAHALLLDLSHDNPCPLTKRTVFDLLPSGALVCMSGGACGSNSGYDTLVPHQIDVVDETRQYAEWEKDVNITSGIIAGKRALNRIHSELGLQGYNQLFVDQVDSDIVAVTRHHPNSHESVLLVAFTCFNAMTSEARGEHGGEGKGITVSGQVTSVILEAGLRHVGGSRFKLPDMSQFSRDAHMINGLTDYQLDLTENVSPSQATYLNIKNLGDGSTRLDFTSKFKPGCVLALRISPMDPAKSALSKLNLVFDLSHNVSSLSLADLNKVLYCCAEEDGGTYNVPGSGSLVYCGLQGILSLMTEVARTNDLGHPVCANLRDGPWLPEFMVGRLRRHSGTAPLAEVLQVLMEPLKSVPPYLVPCYFQLILTRVTEPLVERCYDLMSEFVSEGSTFVKALALTSVQMGGIVQDAPLPALSSSLLPPLPPPVAVTCAAGLPHFATGYMRNWGRDTFIALRGLFLLTGRYQEARFIILGFAGTLRHGLIPNLLDGGYKARYNCRDAVWWWLYIVQCYVKEVPNGLAILQDKVNRLYPTDDSEPTSVDQPLYEVIQEAVERHFQGVVFRERNAGTAIDAHMVSQGFDNQIGVHPVTGFVFGGNQWNCGTWMDKMGSSARAGTKGRPATPRDGSPIELIGLSKATVTWLAEVNRSGDYPYSGVSRTCADGSKIFWTFTEWSDKIQASFESHFWIPLSGPLSPNEARPDLVNRRGIYKDTYGATQAWADYQLRCNFPIAMLVAPELFTPSNARTALSVAEATLLGPGMGMRTLDPGDYNYRGDYNNDNDSDDATVAHGFNYHNGPEWLWPVGFYLRAQLIFSTARGDTIASIRSFLARHFQHLTSDPWRGLPELTNRDGKPCPGSCTTQAWSSSTILEVMYDISKLESQDSLQRQ